MASANKCLTPFQREMLIKQLQSNLRAEYRHRIQIMLMVDEGTPRSKICDAVGCSSETVRYWMSIAQAGKAHLWSEFSIGRPKLVSDSYCDRLKQLVGQEPQSLGYPFRRWTAEWLSKHLEKEFDVKLSNRHVNRLLQEMGLSSKQRKPEQEVQV